MFLTDILLFILDDLTSSTGKASIDLDELVDLIEQRYVFRRF